MDKNQAKTAPNGALGRIQERAVTTTGRATQAAKGNVLKGHGRLQTAYANLKEALKNSRHS